MIGAEWQVFRFSIVFGEGSRLVLIGFGQGKRFLEVWLLDLCGAKSSHERPEQMTHGGHTSKLTLATESKLDLDRGRKCEEEEEEEYNCWQTLGSEETCGARGSTSVNYTTRKKTQKVLNSRTIIDVINIEERHLVL